MRSFKYLTINTSKINNHLFINLFFFFYTFTYFGLIIYLIMLPLNRANKLTPFLNPFVIYGTFFIKLATERSFSYLSFSSLSISASIIYLYDYSGTP